ncbi:hypothetical protein CHUAL_005440 [Chamberlinius hualienensis]
MDNGRDKFALSNIGLNMTGHDTHLNLSLLPTGELLYFVAAVAVLYDRSKHRQRHYTGHTEDIHCLTVHPTRELVATGQKEGKGRHSRAQVHIWDIDTLGTQMIIGLNDVDNGIVALSFSYKNLGQHLLIVDDSPDHMITVWNWKSKRLLSKSSIQRQKIAGGQFIPKDDALVVTYGESHLTVWRRLKDGGFDREDLLDDDTKHITCVEFDEEEEQYLITGDTDGNITLWSDSRTGIYQTLRIIQAHMRAVSALLMLPDGTLLSSGGHEKDRYIKAWDSNHSFRAITFARLPESAGGVQSFCPSKLDSADLGIFAGTAKNMILEGSIHRRFKIVVQGHSRQLSAIAVDPDEPAFVTAGFDKAISRWTMHKLAWKVQVQSECTCLSIHPLGEVVCVGTVDGHIIVLTLHRGMHVATLPATKQVITYVAYSPDGSNLAVALEEGGIILYGVSGRGYSYRRIKIMRGVDQLVHMDWAVDGKAIQSVTSDYNLVFWDIVAMEQEKIPSTLRDVRWHTMTCSLNYTVSGIWNNVNQLSDSVNTTCCVSTSEKLLAVGDDEGYIRLFRYPCVTPRADFHEIKAQSSKVNCVRFLYDDSFLISIGGDDAVLMQWIVTQFK